MMNQYKIKNIHSPEQERIDNSSNVEIDWLVIDALPIDNYPWYKSGKKQKTAVKLCANKEALFLQIIAKDKYSYAKQTELNHMLICEDSCVEFFFSPSGVLGNSYVNLEVNCYGTLHIAYGNHRKNRQFISRQLAKKISCKSNLNSKTEMYHTQNVTNNDDGNWIIEIILPFSVVEKLTGEAVNKEKWYANFYRCGGNIDPQFATWNNINVTDADFHRPECFGKLFFD